MRIFSVRLLALAVAIGLSAPLIAQPGSSLPKSGIAPKYGRFPPRVGWADPLTSTYAGRSEVSIVDSAPAFRFTIPGPSIPS